MLDSERRLFIRQLIANVKCAICQHHYEPADIQLIEHQRDLWVLGVLCSECQTQGLIVAFVREVLADELVQPDVPVEDWESAVVPSPSPNSIALDEVLDLHCFLREFEGDLCDLLRTAR